MTILRYALAALIGALALYSFQPVAPEISYPEVIVRRIIEPDTVVKWRERVVTREVPVAGPVIRAPDQAAPVARAFCSAMVVPGEVVRDTVVLMTSVTMDPGWFWRPDEITLYLAENTGALLEQHYQVRGAWSARRSGPNVMVRSDRFPLQGVVEALGYGLLGYGVGRAW